MKNLGLVGSRLLGLVTSRDFDFITDHDEKLKNVKFHSTRAKLFLIFFWRGGGRGRIFFLDSTKLSLIVSDTKLSDMCSPYDIAVFNR